MLLFQNNLFLCLQRAAYEKEQYSRTQKKHKEESAYDRRKTLQFKRTFRGDEVRGIYFGLSTAQWISIIIFVVYVFKFIRTRSSNH